MNSKLVNIASATTLTLLINLIFVVCAFGQGPSAAPAQLRVTGGSAPEKMSSINLNGEGFMGGSLVSPAKIVVPPGATAVVNFGDAGEVELSEGTLATVTFNNADVSIDLTDGRLKITSLPNASFKIKTVDGTITNDKTRNSLFITEVVGGATGVSTETGAALVNGVPVPAGKVWTADPKLKSAKTKNGNGSRTKKFLKYAAIGAVGVAVGVLIGTRVN